MSRGSTAAARARAFLAVGAGAVGLTLALSACTSSAAPGAAHTPAPTSTAQADVVRAPSPPLPAGSIGTAHVDSADGAISLDLTFAASGRMSTAGFETVTVTSTGQSSTSTRVAGLRLTPYPLGTACLADQFALDLGNLSATTTKGTMLISSDGSDPADGDPSVYRTAVVYDATPPAGAAPAAAGECVTSVLAESTISWSVPHPPAVFDLHDTGSIPDAQGTTAVRAGKPVTYTTAENDSIDQVAKRFGTTVDVLLYLDPEADPVSPFTRLPAGRTISLTLQS